MAVSIIRNQLRCLNASINSVTMKSLLIKDYGAVNLHIQNQIRRFQTSFVVPTNTSSCGSILSCICKQKIDKRYNQTFTSNTLKLLAVKSNDLPTVTYSRNITTVSRLGKRKSCKSVLRRFRRVKGGFLKRWRSGMVHKQRKKSSWRKFRLRGSILVKRESHLRVLNQMIYQIPTEVVNLDLPAKQRWTHIVLPRKDKIIKFLSYTRSLLLFPIRTIVENIIVDGMDKLPSVYKEEIIGIGEALQIPLGEIFAGNIFYELEKLCTSIITQDSNGIVFHARNMDLGALLGWDNNKKTWNIAELLRPLVVNIEFKSGGKVLYKSVQFAGSIGVFTGVAPGRFSVSLNSRSPKHIFGGPMSVFEWVYFSDSKGRFASFWARTVLEKAKDYDDALRMLSEEPLLAPVYYIVGGSRPYQGAVVTRTKTESIYPASFSSNSDQWYLLQTNYDRWKNAPFYDNRREPSNICLNKLYNSVNNGRNQFKLLYNVLSTVPILNKATIYTALMSANNGSLESYQRSCPGLCYPW